MHNIYIYGGSKYLKAHLLTNGRYIKGSDSCNWITESICIFLLKLACFSLNKTAETEQF